MILINTIFWCIPVYLFVIVKRLLPGGPLRQACSKCILWLSGNWVYFNGLLVDHIAKIPIQIDRNDLNLNPEYSYLIVANHQSWVDIIILQKIFHNKVPFLRFFLKKELIWLPFLGIAFWALDFPFMNRYSKQYLEKHPEKKGKDLEATIHTCRKIRNIPFSLINFPEGTRSNPEKIENSKAEHQNLLTPKAGGLAFTLEAFEGNIQHMIDVSILYPESGVDMGKLLRGDISKIQIHIREVVIPEHFGTKSYAEDNQYKQEFQNWMNNIWAEKDEILNQMRQ